MKHNVFIFRDYWSNRNRYCKNVFTENEFPDVAMLKRDSIQSPEFHIVSEKGDRCFLVDANGDAIYNDLKNPELAEKAYEIIKMNEEMSLRSIKALGPVFAILSLLCFVIACMHACVFHPLYDLNAQTVLAIVFTVLLGLIALSTWFARSAKRFWINTLLALGFLMLVFSWLPDFLEVYVTLFQSLLGDSFVFSFAVFFLVSGLGLIFDMAIRVAFNVRASVETPLKIGFFIGILSYVLTLFGVVPCFPSFLIWAFKILSFSTIAVAIVFAVGLAPDQFCCTLYLYDGSQKSSNFPFRNVDDAPVWLKSNLYWVFRWIYFWKYEFTFPHPQPDLERLELWFNALSGELEWVVTDFHYRELWIEWNTDFRNVPIDWDPNFHSIVVYPHRMVADLWYRYISSMNWKLVLLDFPKILSIGNHLRKLCATIRRAYSDVRDLEEVARYFQDIGKTGAVTCSSLTWSYWRYPYGAYPKTKDTKRWERYADSKIGGQGQFASHLQVSFNRDVFRLYGLERDQAKLRFSV